MVCTETKTRGCSGCDILGIDTECDDWLCRAEHRPDGRDTVMKVERFTIDGEGCVKVPYTSCMDCLFVAKNETERPCNSCAPADPYMYKRMEDKL